LHDEQISWLAQPHSFTAALQQGRMQSGLQATLFSQVEDWDFAAAFVEREICRRENCPMLHDAVGEPPRNADVHHR
jgi:hypothetical protein